MCHNDTCPQKPLHTQQALDILVKQREEMMTLLQESISGDGQSGCCGLKAIESVDPDLCSRQIQLLNQRINHEQSRFHASLSSGFVTFSSTMDALVALQLPLSECPHAFDVKPAPEPRDLIWDNLYHSRTSRLVRHIVSVGMVTLLFLVWTIPVGFVASLTTLPKLTKALPWLAPILDWHPSARVFLEGVLSTLSLTMFILVLPYILEAIAKFQVRNHMIERYTASILKYEALQL